MQHLKIPTNSLDTLNIHQYHCHAIRHTHTLSTQRSKLAKNTKYTMHHQKIPQDTQNQGYYLRILAQNLPKHSNATADSN